MKNVLTTCRMVIASMAVCCVVYPLVLLAFGRLAVPEKAAGSLIREGDGRIVGSRLIAQSFSRPEYFWPRPSAVDYNAAAAGGSNFSPMNPALTDRAGEIIGRLGPESDDRVPANLVAASGSGLDPHISLAAARFQAARVAGARGVPVDRVESLIDAELQGRGLQIFGGEPVVNVLLLNIGLDRELPLKRQ